MRDEEGSWRSFRSMIPDTGHPGGGHKELRAQLAYLRRSEMDRLQSLCRKTIRDTRLLFVRLLEEVHSRIKNRLHDMIQYARNCRQLVPCINTLEDFLLEIEQTLAVLFSHPTIFTLPSSYHRPLFVQMRVEHESSRLVQEAVQFAFQDRFRAVSMYRNQKDYHFLQPHYEYMKSQIQNLSTWEVILENELLSHPFLPDPSDFLYL